MELPHIGDHCSQLNCNQLDFLPITCSLCNKKFCNDHHRYEDHNCPESYKIDARVPICPLCENPVPCKRGLSPDLAVNEHMENNCQQKNKKIFKNKCSAKGCKVKELIAIQCDSCNLNFCLKHRHTVDHECKGAEISRRERTLNGSIFRNWKSNSNSNNSSSVSTKSSSTNSSSSSSMSTKPRHPDRGQNSSRADGILHVSPSLRESLQGNISEEEAVRKAILSSQSGSSTQQQNPISMSEDEQLARAIALSLEQQNNQNRQRNTSKSLDCSIS